MTDSSSFTSLLALVDSHLSKTSIQGQSEGASHSLSDHIQIPRLAGQIGVQSDTRLTPPGQRINIPTFQLGSSPIDNLLAQQLSNMLKAKELKRQQEEEQQRLVEETRRLKLEEDKCVIDLMQALQTPYKPEPKKEVISTASSFEDLFEPNFIEECPEEVQMKTPEPLLPLTTDMSYMLRQKVKRGKCSQFGKVLTSRLKPVAAPYLHEMIESNIVRFKFDTPSPCDLIKEKLRKPTSYNTYNFNIFDMI
ncbi:uncharacterized protein LOC134804127 [Cydia splendana]|uniref:uncharacterized protein LOC134804127 n=1 Tax=Cydia splendana TaxID=1100963 RepID=UPI00300CF651